MFAVVQQLRVEMVSRYYLLVLLHNTVSHEKQHSHEMKYEHFMSKLMVLALR